MTTLKKFISCDEAATPGTYQGYFPFSFEPYFSPGWICEAVDAAPTGFIELTDANGILYGYTVIGATAGSYQIEIQAANFGGTYESFLLEFELGTECASEQIIECCDENLEIRWLGREGGIKSWLFGGVREFDIRVGDAITFKNSSRQLQYAQRKNIYTGKRISTKQLTQEQVDFLDELKYCIQAWEVDGDTITPITLDNGSFTKYKSTDKFFEISIQYVIAQEINVQTQ